MYMYRCVYKLTVKHYLRALCVADSRLWMTMPVA